jgi:hypothetical protein
MNKLLRYFDINADVKAGQAPLGRALTPEEKKRQPKAWPQWLALLAGIYIQPALTDFRRTGQWNFALAGWQWFLFSAIVAIVIFPSVYRAAFDDKRPWLVHFAPIFTAGLGWEALFGAAVKIGAKLTGTS